MSIGATSPGVNRRSFLRRAVAGAVAVAVAKAPPAVKAQQNFHGIPRIPVPQAISPFPYYGNAFPNTYSGQYFGNYFGSYLNYGLNSFNPFFYNQFNKRPNNSLYYNRNNSQGSAYRNNAQSGSNSSAQGGNVCCGVKPGTEVTHDDGIVECKLEYPVPLTDAEKAAQEVLYKDVVKSLVRNGYPQVKKDGAIINAPEHLLHYLTPIVIAHDLLNDETLKDIQVGLEQRDPNSKLATYGNAAFFRDAIQVIEFHKAKNAELKGVTQEVLARDIATVTKAIKKTQEEARETEMKKTGKASSFAIEGIDKKAEFIARAYHRLDDSQLEVMIDAADTVSSPDVAVRKQITAEQKFNLEQLTYKVNGELNVIAPNSLVRYFSKLNDNHSDDESDTRKLRELISQKSS